MRSESLAGAQIHVEHLQQVVPRPRTTLPRLAFRPFPSLIDRRAEVESILKNLTSEETSAAELYGEPGIGKTSVLRYVSHQPQATAYPDGIICFSGNQPVADILQFLYEAFYECEVSYKASPGQIRHALQDKRCLVILDDVTLGQQDVETLLQVAPLSTLLLASTDQRLWGEGESIELGGLPEPDVVTLLEREIRRTVTDEERPSALELCAVLGCNPERVLLSAALVRKNERSLSDLVRLLRSGFPDEALGEAAIDGRSEQERKALAVLTVFAQSTVAAKHLGALAGLENTETVIESLEDRNLVESGHGRYRVVASVAAAVAAEVDLTGARAAAIDHFSTWARRGHLTHEAVLQEADAISDLLRWSVQSGHWADALRLARAIERPLALGRRWEAWRHVLESALDSARQIEDPASEAWALHQLGTRAACLGDLPTALDHLSRALRIRRSIGDDGAAVTQHNLDVLRPRTIVRRRRTHDKRRLSDGLRRSLTTLGVVAVATSLLLLVSDDARGWIGGIVGDGTPTPVPPASPTANVLAATATLSSSSGGVVASPSATPAPLGVTPTLPAPTSTSEPAATATATSTVTATATATATIGDTQPPVIAPHDDVRQITYDRIGAIVVYESPVTSDDLAGSGTATCSPASGSQFPVGTTQVTCTASDSAGNEATSTTFDVTVTYVPPQPPVADAGGPYATINEGDTIELDGAGGGADGGQLAYVWEPDTGLNDATLQSPVFTAPDNGVYTFTLTVTDTNGLTDTDTASITVVNVVPTVTFQEWEVSEDGSTVSGTISFTDPGADSWTGHIEYGDDVDDVNTGETLLIDSRNKAATFSHKYSGCLADRKIIVEINDDDDSRNAGEAILQVMAGNACQVDDTGPVLPHVTAETLSSLNTGRRSP
jgi:hypothetical protein